MRGVWIAVGMLAALPLAGCLGITIPPKPLPEWAVQPQTGESPPPHQRVVGRRTATRRGTPDQTASVSYVGPQSASSEVKPFSPEWAAREDALDDKLRRRMHICGGC